MSSSQAPRDLPRHNSYQMSYDTTAGAGYGMTTQQTPQHASHRSNASSGAPLPGSLQPGRPNISSTNTAPSQVPMLASNSSQSQHSSTSSRPSTSSHTHSYSRSSPVGLDQKYMPFINTPDKGHFASPPSNRHTAGKAPPPDASIPFSPLGLSDIRPMSDSQGQEPQSANPFAADANTEPEKSSYLAPWPTYAFDWCKWPLQGHNNNSAGKIALGSYVEDGHNFIQILDTQIKMDTEADQYADAPKYNLDYIKIAEATHSYPVTRILWEPASQQKQSTDLLATSGDHLRLWSLPAAASYNHSNSINARSPNPMATTHKLTPLALLSNSKSPEHTAPLTSLDWNTLSPSLIITSSIDTTCTIWDIPTLTAKTQLIAHDKEVFDVRFCANSVDVFVSCGADGSVRMFDLRSLEHSTIIYEPSEKPEASISPSPSATTATPATPSSSSLPTTPPPPLLRLAASPHDAHLLATFSQEPSSQPSIRILDVRQPGQALLELRGHAAAINCIEWSPTRRGLLASGGDDCSVMIWDLLNGGSGGAASSILSGVGGAAGAQAQGKHVNGVGGAGAGAGGAAGGSAAGQNPDGVGGGGTGQTQGPSARWECDYEVANVSWAPRSGLTTGGGGGAGSRGGDADWLGVCAGRGVWGVEL